MKSFLYILRWFSAVSLVTAHNLFRASGCGVMRLQLGVVAEADEATKSILKSLDGLSARLGKVDEIEKSVAKNSADYSAVVKIAEEMKTELLALRQVQLEQRSLRTPRAGEVSDECARFLGGVVLAAGLRQEKLSTKLAERAEVELKQLLGVHVKTALTTSDIPIPTQWQGDVAELVYQYGIARREGTVLPLGAGVVKLPKLGTDTTFGLIAASGSVTEKSPTVTFVTFTPEKFGGMIRLPSELDDDSIVGMGQFLARYSARQMASVEDWNFFASTGAASGVNGTAEGLTKSVVTDSMFYYNGGSSTSTKTKGSDATLADFRNLRTIPSSAVLQRGKYFLHPSYESLLVSFNTSATVTPYLRGANGQNASLDGFPIVWVPSLPAYSTSAAVSVVTGLFGDATFNYLGIRGGMRYDISREAGFTTDEILVRALERFTVGKMATNCVAGLRNSAS